MANFYAQYPASSGSSGSNASVGSNGSTAPTSSTEIGAINPSGNLQPLATDASGNLKVSLASDVVIGNINLTEVGGSAIALGSTTSSASLPVVLASDQTLSSNAIRTAAGTLSALNNFVAVSTSGAQSVTINTTGSFVGALTFEASNDNTNWSTISVFDYATGTITSVENSTGRLYNAPAVGQQIRLRMSAYTSGSVSVSMTASKSAPSLIFAGQGNTWNIQGTVSEGGSVSGVLPLITGAVYESTLPTFSTNGVASYFHVDNHGLLLVGANGLNGQVASGSADAGNPVKVGGVYNTSGLSLSNGQRGDLQLDSSGNLKVSGTISATNPSVSATGAAVPASATYSGMNVSGNLVGLTGSANGLKVDGSAVTQPISAASLPLPSGASTAANQSTIIAALGSPFQAGGSIGNTAFGISGSLPAGSNAIGSVSVSNFPATQPVSGTVAVSNFPATQPVSAVSLPLPAGAATSALQSSVQGSASGGTAAASSQLDGGIYNSTPPTLTNGQQAALQLDSSGNLKTTASVTIPGTVTVVQPTAANLNATVTGSVSVSNFPATQPVSGTVAISSLPSIPAGSNAIGSVSVSNFPATQPVSGTVSISGTVSNNLTQVGGSAIALGQTTMSASLPVAIASNQSAIPVSAASLPLPSGAATSALQSSVQGPVSPGTAASNSQLSGGVYNSTPPTLTNGQQASLQLDASGNLKVSGSVAQSNPSVGSTGSTAPTSATEIGVINGSGNLVGITQGAAASSASLPVVLSSDQAAIPVVTSASNVVAIPTSNSMAALNAAVQYSVDAGGSYLATLTNGPGATTVWSGTVTFQYSTNGGSSWSSLTATPISTPANSANVTTATANGLFSINVPAGVGSQTVLIRANMTAYTSGTVYFFVEASVQGARVLLPWVYTVTSGNTLVGPLEASGFSEIDVQISAITTTVYTAQGTNDPTAATWAALPVQNWTTQGASAATLTAAATYRIQTNGYKFIRVQCTTTGTVGTIQGVAGTLGQPILLTNFGNDIGVTVNSGTVTTVSTVTSVTAVASVTSTTSVFTNADQASAAITTTTTGATKALTAGDAVSFNVAITAVSGTTPTYDFSVQTSIDGSNWTTVYQMPRQTTTGFYSTPFLQLNGIDYRYVETIGGTTPSFTRAITTNRSTQPGIFYRNLIDRSISLTSSGSTTASLNVEGMASVGMIFYQLVGGSPVTLALDGSDDGSNWVQGIATATGNFTGPNPVPATYGGGSFRFIRARVVTGVASTVLGYVTLWGSPSPAVQSGRSSATPPVYNVYSSTNITTSAYTQLVASTSATTNIVDIFDSSGQAMILATGVSGSEIVQAYIPPGGETQIPLYIPAGVRVAYKALSGNATTGYLTINFLT